MRKSFFYCWIPALSALSLALLSACTPLAAPSPPAAALLSPTPPAPPPPALAISPTIPAPPTLVPTVLMLPTSRPSTPTPTPRPPTPVPDLPTPVPLTRYTLDATLTYAASRLSVAQTVRYVNDTGRPLEALLLVVEPNALPGVFNLQRLALGGEPALYSLDGRELALRPDAPLAAGDVLEIELAYTLDVPLLSRPFGFDGRQLNLADWYPRLPPYDPELGWLIYEPAGVGDHLVYAQADYVVRLVVEDERDDLVIAGPAVAEPLAENGRAFRFTHPAARNVTLSISPAFEIAETMGGDVLIRSFFFPEHRAAGEAALAATAAALELFAELYGPYPHPSLTVVEAGLADGLEFDGFFFLDSGLYRRYAGTPADYLPAIAAHETAHQWFYGIAGSNQPLHPWLDEAPATYSELLFYEAIHPEHVDWWWNTRVRRFPSSDPLDSTIYAGYDFDRFISAVYLRGALFLHDVRLALGDEPFFDFWRAYLTAAAGGQAGPDLFFDLLAEKLPADEVESLRAAYFTSP